MKKKSANNSSIPQQELFENTASSQKGSTIGLHQSVVVSFQRATLARASTAERRVLSEILEHARKIK